MPLARYVLEHGGHLQFPFKRYQIQKVWRGERPQRGRYREFLQCDFDTIGTTAVSSDAEAVLVAHDLMLAAGIINVAVGFAKRKKAGSGDSQ